MKPCKNDYPHLSFHADFERILRVPKYIIFLQFHTLIGDILFFTLELRTLPLDTNVHVFELITNIFQHFHTILR